jgi:P27 family predicted phage terminase small subunit
VWDYTIEELRVMRVMSPADRDALVAYCEAVATHRRASSALAVEDLIVNTERGYVKNPLIQIQRDAAVLMKQYAAEFGLTPRARSEIRVPSAGGGDVRDGLLS